MSYALERDLMNCSIAEVVNQLKSEYNTKDFMTAVDKQLMSLESTKLEFGKYNKMIGDALHYYYKEVFCPGIDFIF